MGDARPPSLLSSAVALARRGWRVFPTFGTRAVAPDDIRCTCGRPACPHPGKHPRIPSWTKLATTNVDLVASWWRSWPDANVAIATGRGLLVIDVDSYKGGEEGLAELVARESGGDALPETVEVVTGGGGRHLFYAVDPEIEIAATLTDLAPGVDVRADGGYVIGAGSLHASGRRYAWEASHHPDDVPIALAPRWLVALLGARRAAAPKAARGVGGRGGGERAEQIASLASCDGPWPEKLTDGRKRHLFKLACSLRAKSLSAEAMLAALRKENPRRCDPPLDDSYLVAACVSAARYPLQANHGRPSTPAKPSPPQRTLVPRRTDAAE